MNYLVAALAVLCGIVYRIYTLYTNKNNHLVDVPGPYYAGFSRLWKTWQFRIKRWDHELLRLHRHYGPVVRIGPNEISVSDAEAVKTVYGHGTKATKSNWYDAFAITSGNLFAETSVPTHGEFRRKIAGVNSMTSVLAIQKTVDTVSALFQKRMEEFADSGTIVQWDRWTQMYAFDVIGQISFGERFGLIEGSGAVTFKTLEVLSHMVELAATMADYPILTKLMSITGPAPWAICYDPMNAASVGQIINLPKQCIQRRHQRLKTEPSNEKDADQLAQLLRQQQTKSVLTDAEIVTAMTQNIFAGSDTTAIALRALFYNLINDPTIYRKVQDEISEADARGTLSEFIQYSEVTNHLPYLCACIQETLRFHPSVGFGMQRIIPPGGFDIAGTHYLEGTRVGISSAVINFDTVLFGNDADVFNPDRWLSHDSTYISKMNASLLTFGFGARVCLGKNISLMELYKFTPQFLRRFDIEWADPSKQEQWRVNSKWFTMQSGMEVIVSKR